MAASDVTAAVFGIVGVLCGAAVTAGTNVWIDTRRRKAEQDEERHLLWATINLLRTDLEAICALLDHIKDSCEWVAPDPRWLVLWDQERQRLAFTLDRDDYSRVAEAFLAVRLWELITGEEPQTLEEGDQERIREWRTGLKVALGILDARLAPLTA
ncbi:MAG: hypothetical protein WB998_14430 [Solirubrobacteraceae bacterium]